MNFMSKIFVKDFSNIEQSIEQQDTVGDGASQESGISDDVRSVIEESEYLINLELNIQTHLMLSINEPESNEKDGSIDEGVGSDDDTSILSSQDDEGKFYIICLIF